MEFNVEIGIMLHTHISLSDVDKRKDKLTKKREQLQKYFFFKQKTAYGIMSGDWSSDVCSSD
eukprot:SAG25_NODE_14617_length_253_cov_0.493506_1_plen_61_part_10